MPASGHRRGGIDVRPTLSITALIFCVVAAVAAQTRPTPAPGTQKPGMAPRPPLLFSESWKLPPYTGPQTDENTRVTPAVVTNANLEVKLYGADSKVARGANGLVERVGRITDSGHAAGQAELPRPDRGRAPALDRADQRRSLPQPG